VQETLDFPRHVFGRARPPPGGSLMPEIMPLYASRLGRHRQDRTIEEGTTT
jgi:hypothetical protein